MRRAIESIPDRSLRRGLAELVIGAVIISLSPLLVGVSDVGPTPAGFYRTLFGAVALTAVVLWRREALPRSPRTLALASLAGLLFAVDLVCWHRAIGYVGPGLATILGNLQVFFLAAFGIVVLRERPDWKFLAAVPVAIFGLFLILGAGKGPLGEAERTGLGYGIATALSYASFLIVLQKARENPPRPSAMMNLAVVSWLSAAILAVATVAEGATFVLPAGRALPAMVVYGIVCQALGWSLISSGLTRVPASRAGLILVLQPMLAFLWDVLFLDRPSEAADYVGVVLVAGAIYLGSLRSRRR